MTLVRSTSPRASKYRRPFWSKNLQTKIQSAFWFKLFHLTLILPSLHLVIYPLTSWRQSTMSFPRYRKSQLFSQYTTDSLFCGKLHSVFIVYIFFCDTANYFPGDVMFLTKSIFFLIYFLISDMMMTWFTEMMSPIFWCSVISSL